MAQTRLLVTVVAAMVLGFLAGQVHGVRAAAQTLLKRRLQTGYMVVSSRPSPRKDGAYRQWRSLARAGMEQLAIGDPKLHVLEGTYGSTET